MTTITLTDEQGIGNKTLEKPFDVAQDSLTLLELLRLRVYGEAEAHNAEGSADFSGLVQPEGGPKRRVDAKLRQKRGCQDTLITSLYAPSTSACNACTIFYATA